MTKLDEALCVRVFWGARRLSTHLLADSASSVVLGAQPDAHIHLPRGRAQFSFVDGAYHCTFSEGLRGERVSSQGHHDQLVELVQQGEATEGEHGWTLRLASNELLRLEAGALRVEALPVAAPKRPSPRLDDVLDYRWLNVLLVCLFVAALGIVKAEAWALSVVDADAPSSAQLSHLRRVLVRAPPKPLLTSRASAEVAASVEKLDPHPKPAPPLKHPPAVPRPSPQGGAPLAGLLQALGSKNVFSNQGLDSEITQAMRGLDASASSALGAAGLGGLTLRQGPAGPGGELERIGAPGLGRVARDRGASAGALCAGKGPCKANVEVLVTDGPPVAVCAPEARVACPDAELIRKVIRSHLSQVRFCYESALQLAPSLAGRVLMNFHIGPAGSVLAAQVNKGLSKELDECLRTRVMLWVFPAASNQGEVSVSYPFVFHPSGQ